MNKRVFTSFSMPDDARYRDFLKGQAVNDASPFSFTDMSVKVPWSSEWKTRCRTKIKGCDGMIVLVGPTTKNADGVDFEIRCAKEEGVPLLGMYISGTQKYPIPAELNGETVVYWSWPNIKSFITAL